MPSRSSRSCAIWRSSSLPRSSASSSSERAATPCARSALVSLPHRSQLAQGGVALARAGLGRASRLAALRSTLRNAIGPSRSMISSRRCRAASCASRSASWAASAASRSAALRRSSCVPADHAARRSLRQHLVELVGCHARDRRSVRIIAPVILIPAPESSHADADRSQPSPVLADVLTRTPQRVHAASCASSSARVIRSCLCGGSSTSSRSATAGRVLILRHDVDQRAVSALELARVERELGISSTWYFRWRTADPDVIAAVRAQGGEVGLHYETLTRRVLGDRVPPDGDLTPLIEPSREELRAEIRAFEQLFGRIDTIAAHGDTRVGGVRNRALVEGLGPAAFGVRHDANVSLRDHRLGAWLSDRSAAKGGWSDGASPGRAPVGRRLSDPLPDPPQQLGQRSRPLARPAPHGSAARAPPRERWPASGAPCPTSRRSPAMRGAKSDEPRPGARPRGPRIARPDHRALPRAGRAARHRLRAADARHQFDARRRPRERAPGGARAQRRPVGPGRSAGCRPRLRIRGPEPLLRRRRRRGGRSRPQGRTLGGRRGHRGRAGAGGVVPARVDPGSRAA